MRFLAFAFLLIAMALPGGASAATTNVSCNGGDITSALNTAISASATGDTVNISAGSCSMSAVTINDKNITIQGAGQGATNITAQGGFGTWITNSSNSPTWRLSGISLSGTGQIVPLTVWANQAASWRGPFRIDHMDFNYPNGGASVYLFGPIYGLIDHCNFTSNYESAILTGLSLSTENGSTVTNLNGADAASLAYQPGGATNLYVEDNTFTGTGSLGIAATDTGYTGARIVFRHNTLMNATMYSHWTSKGNVNSLWWEVYNNKFTWTLGQGMYPMRLQGGGTGLIYNNTFVGFPSNYIIIGEGRLPSQGQSGSPVNYCDGTNNWDGDAGDASAPGWPCLVQTGRNAGVPIAQIQSGNKEPSFPLYVWNNGPQDSCSNPSAGGAACDNSFTVSVYGGENNYFKSTPHKTSGFGNGDVDYSITASQPTGAGTHTLTYTPYTYPHPLAGQSSSSTPTLQIAASSGIVASGTQGGPFSPSTFSYTLSATSGSVNYSISGVPIWLTASATSGTVSTTGTPVTFTINANANSLAAGTYSGTITFTNTVTGQGTQTRSASLTVNPSTGPALQVSTATNISASGTQGGPFSPSSFSYTLNTNTGSVNYSITNVPSWLTASSTSGTATTSPQTITFTINSSANNLAPGSYVSGINFNNTTNNQGNKTVNAILTVTAANYTVAVSASPSADGTVSGGGTFAAGSADTVTATPNNGYKFVNWTANGSVVSTSANYTFTPNSNVSLVANFTPVAATNYTIAVSASPSADGTVSGGGTFAAGSSDTVTATPNNGYKFVNWTVNGSVVSTSAGYTFTVNSNVTLVGNFRHSRQHCIGRCQ
jgi:Divergent InlB B-repeat domain